MDSSFRISSELRSQLQSRITLRPNSPDNEISMKHEISDFYDLELSQRHIEPERHEDLRGLKEASIHHRSQSALDADLTFYRDLMAAPKENLGAIEEVDEAPMVKKKRRQE